MYVCMGQLVFALHAQLRSCFLNCWFERAISKLDHCRC